MVPERPVCDQEVRDRVTSDLRTTFLLEAGAGTGKTRVLVDRYVRCVLDPEHGSGDVRTVAAITFTEKAAGELRQRIREELETRGHSCGDGREAAAVSAALDALDDAPISTIHSFAARLLREVPVQARVDPAFEQLDELAGDLSRRRLWQDWLTVLAAGDEGHAGARAALARLLRAGVALDDVRRLALEGGGVFAERYDLEPVAAPPREPDLAVGVRALAGPLARLREFCLAACADPDDRGFGAALALVEEAERLATAPPSDLDELAAALLRLPVKGSAKALGGRTAAWDDALGGKDELWRRYAPVRDGVEDLRDAYATWLTGLAVAVADAFSRWAAATQVALGQLDFTDLLGRLRDVLRDDLATRGALQRRLAYVLVDEFQDTDPLQAEIVCFLCERGPRAADWRQVVLEPGKLFVVGDPKQSIYRFRRADIALYDTVKRLVAGQPAGSGVVTALRQNFRSTPAVAAWVNSVFEPVFEGGREEGRQPGYQAVEPYRPASSAGRVAVVLGPPYAAGVSVDSIRRDEARAVAALLVAMRNDEAGRWMVHDGDGGSDGEGGGAHVRTARGRQARDDGEPLRAPRWSDIALLYRATTGLETLEEALRAAGVPYRVEGGRTYFARREVDDALLCLRALDDPGDGPALYAALHSTLFGFTDDDLVRFWADGGRFDLTAQRQPRGHGAVVAALSTLRELHERCATDEPHEVVAELLRRTHAYETLAAAGRGEVQAIANLEKLVDRARAFAEAGGGGLGPFLAWAAEAGDAAGEEESLVEAEGDVVRLLTIHKAKGLEFPIVVLVGGAHGGGGGRGAPRPMIDRPRRRLAVKLKAALPGAAACDVEPRVYTELRRRETEMEASENVRLLYVATTRARDHLVLSCFGNLVNKDGTASSVLLAPLAGALPMPERLAGEAERDGVLLLPPRELRPRAARDEPLDVEALLEERDIWLTRRQALLEQAVRPAACTSPSVLEHVGEEARAGGPGAPPGQARARALGSAVHRLLELCDLDDETSIATLAPGVAAELGWPDLVDEAAALARACWRSAPVRAAAASPEVHREVPVGALVEGAVVTGAVDLLYRDGAAWTVVDYKTDREAGEAELRERYTPQGAAYALMVEAATGRRVREIVVVAAAAGGRAVRVAVDDDLRAVARREILAAGDAGRALVGDEASGVRPA